MTNVLTSKKVIVKIGNNTTGAIRSSTPVVLKNAPTLSAATRLDRLEDVVATGETNGATLVYDSATDKYVVKQIEFDEIAGDLDGGTF
jgi:hypothetical protein